MDVERLLKEHINDEEKLLELHHRAIFGDETLGEPGMKKKVDEMHKILTDVRGTGNILGGSLTSLKTLIIIVGIIGIFKGWWISAISAVINK